MGWVKRIKPEHKCNKPQPSKRRGVGSVWRCPRCHKQYRVVTNYRTPASDGWHTIHTWQYQEEE